MNQRTLRIDLPDRRSYDIVVGSGNIGELGTRIRSLGLGEHIFLISSPRIYELHGRVVEEALRAGGAREITHTLVPDGEENKSFQEYQRVLTSLAEFDASENKKLLIINLGGGVVGDLGGHVAATFRRGTDYVQVPTTLLANVDCGIGGKVGVNFKNIKNIIGHFYQPRLVFCDLGLLSTLDISEIRSGMAEVLKYGVIMDAELFDLLEKRHGELLSLDRDLLQDVVLRCLAHKTKVVRDDETDEKGIRVILNYGHTVGHALEAATDYGTYRHGEAVAIGMVCEADISRTLGLLSDGDFSRIEHLISRVGLPTRMPRIGLDRIRESMRHDKKFVNGVNRFVLPTGIGSVQVREGVSQAVISQALSARMDPSIRLV